MTTSRVLKEIYQRLYQRFGPQQWWPAQTRFEVMVGAILTQNTNWNNVKKAVDNLRRAKLLIPQNLRNITEADLSGFIRPAGYFKIKAKRLKNFVDFLFREFQGNLDVMAQQPLSELRKKLLTVNGIGPETADSILLYALQKPIFVVDAYTKRFLFRHNWIRSDADYENVQHLFMDSLAARHGLFNEFHALIVRLGKELCATHPRCEGCPLMDLIYSLKFKCFLCHRSLLRPRERKRFHFGRKPRFRINDILSAQIKGYGKRLDKRNLKKMFREEPNPDRWVCPECFHLLESHFST